MDLNEHETRLVELCEEAGLTFVATTDLLAFFREAPRRESVGAAGMLVSLGVATDEHGPTPAPKAKRQAKKVARQMVKREPKKNAASLPGAPRLRTCVQCGETKKAWGSFRGDTCKKCLTTMRSGNSRAAKSKRVKEEDPAPEVIEAPPATVKEKMERERVRVRPPRVGKGTVNVQGLYRLPVKSAGSERMVTCLFCDEKKSLKEMWRGRECLACHAKK